MLTETTTRTTLIFLYDALISKAEDLGLQFVTFAKCDGKLYHIRETNKRSKYKKTLFAIQPNVKKAREDESIYGALYTLPGFGFTIRNIDAYYTCSLSRLYTNHKLDLMHRHVTAITPVHISSVSAFERMQYTEGSEVFAWVYYANPEHPIIARRIKRNGNSLRGVCSAMRTKIEEETHGRGK